jgi:hypothetical protein
MSAFLGANGGGFMGGSSSFYGGGGGMMNPLYSGGMGGAYGMN